MPPSLLLLPGTLCDRRLFAPLWRRLRPQVAVRALSWREAERLPGAGTGLNLLGFSLGGLRALQCLREAPRSVARLALVASNAEPASALTRRRARQQRRTLRRGTAAVARQALPAYFAQPAPPRWQRLVLDMAARTPRGVFLRQLRLVGTRPASHVALAAFAGPLLLLGGTHDPLSPPAWQRRMQAAQPRARLRLLRRCGHFIPLQAPAALAHAVRAWLATPCGSPE